MIGFHVYRVLIRLYPAEFRIQFEREMTAAFLDAREASRSSVSLLSRELLSVLTGSLVERIADPGRCRAFVVGSLVAYSIHVALYTLLVTAGGKPLVISPELWAGLLIGTALLIGEPARRTS